MAANLSVNQICHLIFTKDPAIHLLNQHPEFYYVLTIQLIEIVIRKFFQILTVFHQTNPVGKWKNIKKISFDGTSFEETASSKVSHQETFGMGNYKGQALTTGCSTSGACGLRTEIMDMDRMRWSDEEDYPYPA